MSELIDDVRILLRNIICQTECLNSEVDVFDLEAARIWQQFNDGAGPAQAISVENGEDFEFGGSAVGFLQLVALLWGTYKMIEDIKHRISAHWAHREAFQKETTQTWIEHLTAAGLRPEVAEEIVKSHGVRAAEAVLLYVE